MHKVFLVFLVRSVCFLEVPLRTRACRGGGMLAHASQDWDGSGVTIVAGLGSSEHGVVSVGDVSKPIPGLFHDSRRVDLEGRRGRCDLGSDVGPQHATIGNSIGFQPSSKSPRCRLGCARVTVPVTSDISSRALTRRSCGIRRDLDPAAERTPLM